MKISTKGRYALRIMLDLAQRQGEGYVPLKEIAARQNISEKYLEQIVAQLNRAGYLRSTRGAQGGYKLAKEASAYTVGMILRCMEGSLAPVRCVEEGEGCSMESECATVEVWRRIKEAVDEVVDNMRIDELAEHCNSKPEDCPS